MIPVSTKTALAAALGLASSILAQEPSADRSGWTEGYAMGVSYRAALTDALEDAIGKAKGVDVRRSAVLRSRLAVVSGHEKDVEKGWFTGEGQAEQEWVQQQVAGFVQTYEVVKKGRSDNGQWEVTVRAKIATQEDAAAFVIDLTQDQPDQYELHRFEEDRAQEWALLKGQYEVRPLGEALRKTGAIRITAKSGGVKVGPGSEVKEREKQGRQLVPSHRVEVKWQPFQLQSLRERAYNNPALKNVPREEFLTSASVQVVVRITDLVQDVEVMERTLPIALQIAPATRLDRVDAIAKELGELATATVAECVLFALRPPVVKTKRAGDGGKWFVEVAIAKRALLGCDAFEVGNDGTVRSANWQRLGRAKLIGGTDVCTFELVDIEDPALVQEGITEVRPAQK